mmetsp:Transcript_23081/g.58795  ORF Transcript_23081/g.58795 Transcript_23081/m.58795 type:complete len:293 (+) Transcript_23081:509-1387(+)
MAAAAIPEEVEASAAAAAAETGRLLRRRRRGRRSASHAEQVERIVVRRRRSRPALAARRGQEDGAALAAGSRQFGHKASDTRRGSRSCTSACRASLVLPAATIVLVVGPVPAVSGPAVVVSALAVVVPLVAAPVPWALRVAGAAALRLTAGIAAGPTGAAAAGGLGLEPVELRLEHVLERLVLHRLSLHVACTHNLHTILGLGGHPTLHRRDDTGSSTRQLDNGHNFVGCQLVHLRGRGLVAGSNQGAALVRHLEVEGRLLGGSVLAQVLDGVIEFVQDLRRHISELVFEDR